MKYWGGGDGMKIHATPPPPHLKYGGGGIFPPYYVYSPEVMLMRDTGNIVEEVKIKI